jgi:hypothetical protein
MSRDLRIADLTLDARASVEGVSRSDIVRSVIDRELNLDEDDTLDAQIGDLAGEFAEAACRSRCAPSSTTSGVS